MSVMDRALTTLVSAKLLAGVSTSTDDALFERLINAASATVSSICGRVFGSSAGLLSYVEKLSASNRQLLVLNQWPIVGDPVVVIDDATLELGVDYRCDEKDKAAGMLFRLTGWTGPYAVRGLTGDPVGGDRTIEVTYSAGYYLPGDATHYIAGDPASLPLEISDVIDQMVAEKYYDIKRQHQNNLRSLSEGGLSYSWGVDSGAYGNILPGISDAYATVLVNYKRIFAA